jgi:acetyltransferase-like isoleucine patch superfamily enzyme
VLMHKVQIAYQLWKHVHWLITAFNNIEPKVQIHLIYEFIRLNTEISNIGKAKIDLIIDFIKKGKNNGKLRLGNNYFLTKDVNNIHIIKDI